MTPEDLAARHPELYHLTLAESVDSIMRHGLLATSKLLTLFDIPAERRLTIEAGRRKSRVTIDHPAYGTAIITDNQPIVMASLAACLDDGLQPSDWLRILNARVFFWVADDGLQTLLGARLNRGRNLAVIVADTLSLARAHHATLEVSPINSGATVRRPPRRGLATFTPLAAHTYSEWRTLRGGKDRIREVTILGGVPDISVHMSRVVFHGAMK